MLTAGISTLRCITRILSCDLGTVTQCCGAFTSLKRVVSGEEAVGGFSFEFEAVRTAIAPNDYAPRKSV